MKTSKKTKQHDFLSDGFDLPKVEEKVLEFWDTNGIFEKTLALRQAQGKKHFVFFEGPPYANGKPGIHHVLARIFKDIVLRYKTMQGYYVPRKGGWDTHGLPVEMAAEKALGFKSKRDIEKFGIAKFNAEAKKAVWLYKEEWERLTERMGYWLDLKNAYVTYSADYIESVWWTMQQIAKRKLLYKGHKVVPWCTRCGTALSSHELAMGYEEVTDNSVYVKFKVKSSKFKIDGPLYILSWTTTPWTLPGNVALAVGEKITYVIFSGKTKRERGKELYIIAKERLDAVMGSGNYDVIREIKGKDLVGLEYESLFKISALKNDKAYKIYPASFVTTSDGTGVVHTAVMYGEDDYKLGIKVGLPQHHTVTEEGVFTKEVPGLGGLPVKAKATEDKIFKHLTESANLLRTEIYTHEYPHCWRCGTPVLYYARNSWFIAMSKLRAKLLANNKKVNWVPSHVKDGRFGEWLREAKDWNLSRERYWGTPLPIWECKKCKTYEVIGSVDELAKRAGRSRNVYTVVRHGESLANTRGILDAGSRKLPLTTIGADEARRIVGKLKGEKIDLIVASDVMRTAETAQDVAAELGIPVHFDQRLREINLGDLLGRSVDEYHRLFPTLLDRFERRPENGESLRDLRARVWVFLEDLERKYRGKHILIVSHEYPIWMMSQAALGWTERQAIAEKERRGDDFVAFAKPEPLAVKTISRNETGEIDLHRPFIDHVMIPCKKCGEKMKRVPEVADVWYDSGAMPFAQEHWPFAHAKSEKRKAKSFGLPEAYPADYISEGVDQTRGWFYTLMAISTALGFESPYQNVVCLGLINDKNGQKMSKSKGNIVEPFAVIDKYGVDAVRWYFFSATPPGDTKNFDENEIAKTFRRFHLIIYNSLVFWQTYADKSAKRKAQSEKRINILDRWILARLDETIHAVTRGFERYEIREAALAIEALVDDLSRWFIRRSRRRLQLGHRSLGEGGKPESRADYTSASATLGRVLLELSKLIAPFTPFFAEMLYQACSEQWAVGSTKTSVHLEDWPLDAARGKPLSATDREMIAQMAEVRRIASSALAKRAELGIKVRQPLASLKIRNPKSEIRNKHEMLEILKDEVNVKDVVFDEQLKDELEFDTVITPELKTEGVLRELVRAVQELRQTANLKPADKVVLMLDAANLQTIVAENETFVKKEVGAKAIEYKKSAKFDAEVSTKLDGEEVWLALRKV